MENHLEKINIALKDANICFVMENKSKKISLDMSQLRDEHFDGHTEFFRLTPQQRLDWLAAAVQFYYEHKDKKKIISKKGIPPGK